MLPCPVIIVVKLEVVLILNFSLSPILGKKDRGQAEIENCEYCVLSGRGLCDGLITRPQGSYRLWHVVVCDQETLYTRRL